MWLGWSRRCHSSPEEVFRRQEALLTVASRTNTPFAILVAKFTGGVLSLTAGLSLGREGPSVQIGSYVGCLVSKWTHLLAGERKQLLAAGAGAGFGSCFCCSFGLIAVGYRIYRAFRCTQNSHYNPACRSGGRRRCQSYLSYDQLFAHQCHSSPRPTSIRRSSCFCFWLYWFRCLVSSTRRSHRSSGESIRV